jgi:hypothetical protein
MNKIKGLLFIFSFFYNSILNSEEAIKTYEDLVIDANKLNLKLPKIMDNEGVVTLIEVIPKKPLVMEFYYRINTEILYTQVANELGVTLEYFRNMMHGKDDEINAVNILEVREMAENEKKKMCSPTGEILHKPILQDVIIKRIYSTENGEYIATNVFDKKMCE